MGSKKLRTKFKNVWVLLDGQQLTYYEKFDLEDGVPAGLLGVLHLPGATISKLELNGVKHGIYIKKEKGKAGLYFDCKDASQCTSWYNALNRTLNAKEAEEAIREVPYKSREILGLDADVQLSKSLIARTYKKLCLKEHPDKGGDVEKFNQISDAYNSLMDLQTYQDERDSTVPVQYEATVRKGG